jgi:hypothetical protein
MISRRETWEWLVSGARGALFATLGAAVLVSALGSQARGGETVASAEETAGRRFMEWDSTNRRDPFNFRDADAPRRVIETPVGLPGDGEPLPPPPPPTNTASAEEIRRFAEKSALDAERAIGLRNFSRAEEYTQEALSKLEGLQIPDSAVAERLDRAHRTAQRLRTREEVEKEFKNIAIEIQGIIWEPENPVALIKGQTIREGMTVEGALVEEIRTGEIIFNYKGIRCSRSPGH